jgi:hypothetical protein
MAAISEVYANLSSLYEEVDRIDRNPKQDGLARLHQIRLQANGFYPNTREDRDMQRQVFDKINASELNILAFMQAIDAPQPLVRQPARHVALDAFLRQHRLNEPTHFIEANRNQFAANDPATCTYNAVETVSALLQALTDRLGYIPNAAFLDAALEKGAALKNRQGVQNREHVELPAVAAAHGELRREEYSQINHMGIYQCILPEGNGRESYLRIINEMIDRAPRNNGLVGAAIIKNPATFGLVVDIRGERPMIYFSDSHTSDYSAKAHSLVFSAPQDAARFLAAAYPSTIQVGQRREFDPEYAQFEMHFLTRNEPARVSCTQKVVNFIRRFL